MNKKDIYEHLASIYLDTSKKKRKTKEQTLYKKVFFISIIFVLGLTAFLTIPSIKRTSFIKSESILILKPDIVKLNFNFETAQKEVYSLNLKGMDLTRFKILAFSIKKSNFENDLSLRVEFNSAFKETSEVYLNDILHKWKECKINLSEFKNISDWSKMNNLSFIIETWNVKEKNGAVYIENIRLIK
ncbi:MAG: hypothetical protein NC912_02305 [Candidatus Omnitrophica bacterium]|nr:hypothetical protein [Candidatus Omnitrophota bacterium]